MAKPVIVEKKLFADVVRLIEESRSLVAQTVNSALTLLYWKIGHRVNEEVLKNRRAEYGKRVIMSMALQLTENYGNGYSEKNIRHMMQFAETFPDEAIVALVMRQLSLLNLSKKEMKKPNTAANCLRSFLKT